MDALIFDMDGVLVDSEQYWHHEQEKLLADAVEEDTVTPEDIQGMNPADQYDHLNKEYTVVMSKQRFLEYYHDHAATVYQEKAALLDGARDLLDDVRDHDVRTAIASSSFRTWVEMVADRFDLTPLFDAIVSADSIDGRSKPAPDIYLHAADELGVDPADCVVVEDSEHGVTAAKEAGMTCIGYHPGDSDHTLDAADTVVDSPAALREAVQAHLRD